jgi:hypothetical protein
VRKRLASREIESRLAPQIDRSRLAASRLDETVPVDVVRLDTSRDDVATIAAKMIVLTGWTS